MRLNQEKELARASYCIDMAGAGSAVPFASSDWQAGPGSRLGPRCPAHASKEEQRQLYSRITMPCHPQHKRRQAALCHFLLVRPHPALDSEHVKRLRLPLFLSVSKSSDSTEYEELCSMLMLQ